MSAAEKCIICKKPSKYTCGNCKNVSYCCKEHQKENWKNHKYSCLPFKIVSNDEIGRHLIATRALSEGDIVINEGPIVIGPSQVTPPVCLGCYDLITEFNRKDCSVCGWPVCSQKCEKSLNHRPECQITTKYKKNKVKINTFAKNLSHPSYQCLTVLRCLYLKENSPKLWEKLIKLESHCEERKNTIKYNSDLQYIAEFIPNFFKYNEFSKEEILKVAGIVQVNAHEIPLKEPGYIGIYEKASLLEHSCRANCMKSFTNSGELIIRAAQNISAGEHFSICYTDAMWGREMRINHLLETKFFLCKCIRCSDSTELGTHFNSLLCSSMDCNGCVVPSLDLKPEEIKKINIKHATWECEQCRKVSSEETSSFVSKIYDRLALVDKKDIKSCQEFLNEYDKSLHPNHNLVLGIKLALIDLFAWQEHILSIKQQDLEWTVKTCKEVYSVVTNLMPAENRLRGVLLYQLYIVLMEFGRRRTARKDQALLTQDNLMECNNVLSKALSLLQYEPDEMPEGKMAAEAKKALKSLQTYIQSM